MRKNDGNAIELEAGSIIMGKLPKGCEHCRLGAKMVMLVTGLCDRSCFYCPLSEHKMKRDVMYANELKVEDESEYLKEAIAEARSIDAEGAGITGGDPLRVPDRTIMLIKGLKKEFGKMFHIHLYTAMHFDEKYIGMLASAGLDEIRFHPPENVWPSMKGTKYDMLIKSSLKTKMDVGVEIPLLLGSASKIVALARYLDEIGVKFLNLNELEFSETNVASLRKKGYDVRDDVSSAVAGSREVGKEVIMELSRALPKRLSVHLCTSSFKDAVQLRKRLERRAKKTARPYHDITNEGTFEYGIIESDDKTKLRALEKRLKEKYEVPEEMIHFDEEKGRIETASWILEELAQTLKRLKGCKLYMATIEEYPTADRLEVERTPL